MNLADLRRVSVRRQFRIRFRLANGMECVITEHGIAEVPGLKQVPNFDLERELASATEFLLEQTAGKDRKSPPKPRSVGREELAALVSSAAGGPPRREEE